MKLLRKVKGKWIAVSAATVLATIVMQQAPVAAEEYTNQATVEMVEQISTNELTATQNNEGTVNATNAVNTASLVSNELPTEQSETPSTESATQTNENVTSPTSEQISTKSEGEQQAELTSTPQTEHTSKQDEEQQNEEKVVTTEEKKDVPVVTQTPVSATLPIEVTEETAGVTNSLQSQTQTTTEQPITTETSENLLSQPIVNITPATVAQSTQTIEDVKKELTTVLVVNREQLQTALDAAKHIDTTNKYSGSVVPLEDAIAQAQQLVTKTDLTDEELSVAYQALQNAIEGLVDNPETPTVELPEFPQYKLPLLVALQNAEQVNRINATPQSLQRLDAAVAEGTTIVTDQNITDLQRIVVSITEIMNSISGMERIETLIPNETLSYDLKEVNEEVFAEIVATEKQVENAKTETSKKVLTTSIADAYKVLDQTEVTPEEAAEVINTLKQTVLKLPLHDTLEVAKNTPLDGRSGIAVLALYDSIDKATKVIEAKDAVQQQIEESIQLIEQTTLKLSLYDQYEKAIKEDLSNRSQMAKDALQSAVEQVINVIDNGAATSEEVTSAQTHIEQVLMKLPLYDKVSQLNALDTTSNSQMAKDALAKQMEEATTLLESENATIAEVQQVQTNLDRTVAKFPLFDVVEQTEAMDITNHSSYAKALLHKVKAEATIALNDANTDDETISTVANKLVQTAKKLSLYDQIDAISKIDSAKHLATAQKELSIASELANVVVNNPNATDEEIAEAALRLEQTKVKLPLYDAIDVANKEDLASRSGQAVVAFYTALNKANATSVETNVTAELVNQTIVELQQTVAKLSLYDAKSAAEVAKNYADTKELSLAARLLATALEDAQVTIDDIQATASDIRRATRVLTVATNKLPLFETVEQAQEMVEGKLKYTTAALNYRIQLANIVLNDPNSSKALIDAEITRLNQVIAKIPVYEAKSKAENAMHNRSSYARAILKEVFDQANNLITQTEVTAKAMDEVAQAVDEVIARVPSYDVLSDKVSQAQRMKNGQTNEAVQTLNNTIADSLKLLEKNDSTIQSLLDQSVLVDYTLAKLPLFTVVQQAETMNTNGKTTASIRNLQTAIRRARVVLNNKNATPTATADAISSVRNAMSGLQDIPSRNTGNSNNNGGNNAGPIVVPAPAPDSDAGSGTVPPSTSGPTTPPTNSPSTRGTGLTTPEIRLLPSQTSPVSTIVESINQVGRIFQTEDTAEDEAENTQTQTTETVTTTQQAEIQVNNTQPYVSLINMVLDTTTIPGIIAIAVVSITGTVGVVLYRRVV